MASKTLADRNKYLRIGAAAVVFAALLWAVDMILLTPQLYHLDVAVVVFLLHLIPSIFMLIPLIIEWREVKKLGRKDWIIFALLALLSGAIGTMAITKALFYVNYVNLSVVAFLQKLQPIFTILMAVILLKERPRKSFFLWAAVALAGSYLVTFGFAKPNFDVGDKVFLASLFSILAAAAFGTGTALSKHVITKVNYRVGTYLRFVLTAIIMLVFLIATGKLAGISLVQPKDLIIFLIIAFTTGGTAIFIYYYGLARIPASLSSICELMMPFSAVVFEYLIRKSLMSPGQWLGAGLLVAAVLAITLGKAGIKETGIREARKPHSGKQA